jgi:hypothetical protein
VAHRLLHIGVARGQHLAHDVDDHLARGLVLQQVRRAQGDAGCMVAAAAVARRPVPGAAVVAEELVCCRVVGVGGRGTLQLLQDLLRRLPALLRPALPLDVGRALLGCCGGGRCGCACCCACCCCCCCCCCCDCCLGIGVGIGVGVGLVVLQLGQGPRRQLWVARLLLQGGALTRSGLLCVQGQIC